MIGSRGPYSLHLIEDPKLPTGGLLVMANDYGGQTALCHYEIDAEDARRIAKALDEFAARKP